jgi:hypothetical protein
MDISKFDHTRVIFFEATGDAVSASNIQDVIKALGVNMVHGIAVYDENEGKLAVLQPCMQVVGGQDLFVNQYEQVFSINTTDESEFPQNITVGV